MTGFPRIPSLLWIWSQSSFSSCRKESTKDGYTQESENGSGSHKVWLLNSVLFGYFLRLVGHPGTLHFDEVWIWSWVCLKLHITAMFHVSHNSDHSWCQSPVNNWILLPLMCVLLLFLQTVMGFHLGYFRPLASITLATSVKNVYVL